MIETVILISSILLLVGLPFLYLESRTTSSVHKDLLIEGKLNQEEWVKAIENQYQAWKAEGKL